MSAINTILGNRPTHFQTPAPKARQFGLRCACVHCGCKIEDPKVEITVMGEIEKNDYILSLAHSKGWVSSREGPRILLACPDCTKKIQKAQTDPLPKFVEVCACAKCGGADMGIKFCDGRVMCALGAVRDHLHRSCPRCGYTFVQACKDEKETSDVSSS